MSENSAGHGDPRHRRGRAGEEIASTYLEERGYEILARNFRSRYGEIDMIARQGEVVAFIEVKSRRGRRYGRPFEAVDRRKQGQIRNMASMWLAAHQHDRDLRECSFRFDVISILFDSNGQLTSVDMMEDAFR